MNHNYESKDRHLDHIIWLERMGLMETENIIWSSFWDYTDWIKKIH